MPKLKRKEKTDNYFDKAVENAIIEFQTETNVEKRKKIFVEKIKFAFEKLAENVIFVYKFNNLGEVPALKSDCVSFLFELISKKKYNKNKGKAFSYLNVITRNFFVQKVKARRKKVRTNVRLDKALLAKLEQSENEAVFVSYEDEVLKKEFLILLKQEVKKWREKFDKHQEKIVLEAVILLLENPDAISIYNKKGIYLYIREITGLNTKQVVTNLNKIKKKYRIFKKKYLAGEI